MVAKKITIILMLASTILLIGWDIAVVLNDERGDTISEIIFNLARSHFTIPFLLGMIMGHWFWPRDFPVFGMSRNSAFLYLALPIAVVASLVDVFVNVSWVVPIMPVLGYILGHLTWPQSVVKINVSYLNGRDSA